MFECRIYSMSHCTGTLAETAEARAQMSTSVSEINTIILQGHIFTGTKPLPLLPVPSDHKKLEEHTQRPGLCAEPPVIHGYGCVLLGGEYQRGEGLAG